MKVLFLSSVFPQPYDATRGVFSARLCRAITRHHRLAVVAPRPWTDALTLWKRRGNRDARHDFDGQAEVRRPLYVFPPRLMQWAYDWCMWASAGPAIRLLLDRFRPDCILSYWAHPDGAVAVRAAQRAGVPAGIIVGGSDVLLLTRQPRRRQRIAAALQAAQAVFTVSADLHSRVRDLGIDPERVHLVHQGIDHQQFHPGDRREARRKLGIDPGVPMLLYVGRLAPVKGLDVLLQAAALLQARQPAFRLYLIGDGPLRGALEAQANSLGLREQVIFAGARLPPELPDWYRAADWTVLSSHSEGIPNVLRESAACGTPFVATRVGGVAEIADPACDRLVPAGNAAALAAALVQALADQPNLKQRPRQFQSWSDQARTLLSILRPDLSAT